LDNIYVQHMYRICLKSYFLIFCNTLISYSFFASMLCFLCNRNSIFMLKGNVCYMPDSLIRHWLEMNIIISTCSTFLVSFAYYKRQYEIFCIKYLLYTSCMPIMMMILILMICKIKLYINLHSCNYQTHKPN
jgi:hypothetical protein